MKVDTVIRRLADGRNIQMRLEELFREARVELTPLQFEVLAYFRMAERNKRVVKTMGEAQRQFRMQPQVMSGVMDRLEAGGFAKRDARRPGEDQRLVWVVLTDKARKELDRIAALVGRLADDPLQETPDVSDL